MKNFDELEYLRDEAIVLAERRAEEDHIWDKMNKPRVRIFLQVGNKSYEHVWNSERIIGRKHGKTRTRLQSV
jgi:hypothetical protein